MEAKVPGEPVNVIPMLVEPVTVKLSNNGGDIKKVAIVEVVIVVVAVSKVDPRVVSASFINEAAPRRLVRREGRRGRIKPVLKRSLKVVDNWRNKIGPSKIISSQGLIHYISILSHLVITKSGTQ